MSSFIILSVSLFHILLTVRLTFCIGTEIPYFFCELAQVLKVDCSDNLINNVSFYVTTALLCVFPLTGILFSHLQIVSSLIRMSSAGEKNIKHFTFSLRVSPLGSLLVNMERAWGTTSVLLPGVLPRFCCNPFFPEKLNRLSDVYQGHVHAETLRLQLDVADYYYHLCYL
ncbi:hypothetical protein HPG69_008175 [Diceros bicornis minor]|uniref:Olfactory receptor n=1 Tax=Diceros bicornis minor TaxID=77932 RepID=A0A7J7E759_DICBM|nr:hypothetical protein HPG69_008175 [Diceros bicornis minor]